MPDYGWNEVAGRYINLDTGQFISSSKVRDALESVMDAANGHMNSLTMDLIGHNISLVQWQSAMMQEIKLAHTAAAASANGGWAQMTQSDWGFAGRLIRTQYEHLEKFANQIANGEQPLDGRALMRANLYGQAPRGTYEAQRQRQEILVNGMEEERRILEKDGANCQGCLDQAELGWQPVGTLDPIGAEECLTNCRCEFEYRKPDGEIISEGE